MLRALPHLFEAPLGKVALAAARFARHRLGTTAVEFGLIVVPFAALLFAILETALVFFAGQALETGVQDASRFLLTGQAQAANWGSGAPGVPATTEQKVALFRTEICKKAGALIDCGKVMIDVKTASNFNGANAGVTIDKGKVDCSAFDFKPGGPGQIVVVRALYAYPIYVSLWNSGIVNLTGNKRLLAASAAFRNEPFPSGGPAGGPAPPSSTCPTS